MALVVGALGKIVIGIVLILGVVVFLSLFQFFISVHPPKFRDSDVPSNYGIKYENISFTTSDGITIKGWLILSNLRKGTIVIGHGYPFDKGNILHLTKFLYPDYNLLFYDHRSFGESSGSISTAGIKETKDVEAAVKFIRSRFGKENPIALYGFSLSASSMIMANVNVNAIIADSPYADLEAMIKHMYSFFGPFRSPFVKTTSFFVKLFFKVNPKEVSPAQSSKKLKIPLFVIHGDKDSQIPVEHAHMIKSSNPNTELWVVENADHGEAHAVMKEEYEKRVRDFLKKNIGY